MLTEHRPGQSDAVLFDGLVQRGYVGEVVATHLNIVDGIGLLGGDRFGGDGGLLRVLGGVGGGLHHLAAVAGGDALGVKGYIQMEGPVYILLPIATAQQKLPRFAHTLADVSNVLVLFRNGCHPVLHCNHTSLLSVRGGCFPRQRFRALFDTSFT